MDKLSGTNAPGYESYATLLMPVVNALPSEQVWPSNVRNYPQSWAPVHTFSGKPLRIRLLPSMSC